MLFNLFRFFLPTLYKYKGLISKKITNNLTFLNLNKSLDVKNIYILNDNKTHFLRVFYIIFTTHIKVMNLL